MMKQQMRHVLIRNCVILILFLVGSKIYNFEKPTSSELMALALPGQDSSKPPFILINNRQPYSHNVDLSDNEIFVKPDTFFCLAQVAEVSKSSNPDTPQDPIITVNYEVNGFNDKGLEMVGKRTQFVPELKKYWNYLIFQSKKRKGTFEISLVPFKKDIVEKKIKVIVS